MVALDDRRCTTPRTGTAWCAGCRRGRRVTPWPIQKRKTSRAPATARASRRSRSRTGRCPGTSSAGSRRTGWCRRAVLGTSRDARVTHGWSGEDWKAMSSAISMPRVARRANQAIEVRRGAELGMDRGVAALGATDRPRAAGVGALGVERVVRALAELRADRDGSAAGTARRSPARRRSRAGRSTSSKVPWRSGPVTPSGETARTRR